MSALSPLATPYDALAMMLLAVRSNVVFDCISLRRSQFSVSSAKMRSASVEIDSCLGVPAFGRWSREMATIDDTIVVICVRFSFSCTPWAPSRSADNNDWIECTIASVCTSM